MAEHFKYYPSDEEVVTPFNARYSYPSQANKATKMTPRIPPKNGSVFTPGQIIRLEFPAQGYVNPLNTMLEFDVVLVAPSGSGDFAMRFQNNIQCIFNRVRLLYGATPSEDIIQYGLLVRCLTEWTGGNVSGTSDRSCISDGIGGSDLAQGFTTFTPGSLTSITAAADTITIVGTGLPTSGALYVLNNTAQPALNGLYQIKTGSTSTSLLLPNSFAVPTGSVATTGTSFFVLSGDATLQNTRQVMVQGICRVGANLDVVPNNSISTALPGGVQPVSGAIYCTRRYMINLALGIMTQDKLIPTKYMASQLAIEITLEQVQSCIFMEFGSTVTTPTYYIGNINLIPEIIEFDDTYDEMFMKALESGGVPLKFSTWHYFQFTTQGSSSLQLQITERSRSVKGIFVVQRRNPPDLQYDSHACFMDTYPAFSATDGSTMQSFQYRIGGRYFPAAPVQLSINVGGSVCNGGAEAYVELEKFLNIVGRYDIAGNTKLDSWAIPSLITNATASTANAFLSEYDYSLILQGNNAYGIPASARLTPSVIVRATATPSSLFASAVNFETSNGIEISGLNAEEQSDISFNVQWYKNQQTGFTIEAFTYVDVMWVLRPNNYLDLIQ